MSSALKLALFFLMQIQGQGHGHMDIHTTSISICSLFFIFTLIIFIWQKTLRLQPLERKQFWVLSTYDGSTYQMYNRINQRIPSEVDSNRYKQIGRHMKRTETHISFSYCNNYTLEVCITNCLRLDWDRAGPSSRYAYSYRSDIHKISLRIGVLCLIRDA